MRRSGCRPPSAMVSKLLLGGLLVLTLSCTRKSRESEVAMVLLQWEGQSHAVMSGTVQGARDGKHLRLAGGPLRVDRLGQVTIAVDWSAGSVSGHVDIEGKSCPITAGGPGFLTHDGAQHPAFSGTCQDPSGQTHNFVIGYEESKR